MREWRDLFGQVPEVRGAPDRELVRQHRYETQRREFDRIGREMSAAQETRASGKFMMGGAGERTVTVLFGVAFAEQPILSYGGEVKQGDLVPGQYPELSVVVHGWVTDDRGPTSRLFLGANLAVVTRGPFWQKMYVYWHFDGVGYTSPIG